MVLPNSKDSFGDISKKQKNSFRERSENLEIPQKIWPFWEFLDSGKWLKLGI